MICLRCGREITGKGGVCRGCGYTVKKEKKKLNLKIKLASPKKVMNKRTRFFDLKVWQLLVTIVSAMAVLCVGLFVVPKISFKLPQITKPEQTVKTTTTTTAALDTVVNTRDMLYISGNYMNSYILNYQDAYSDVTMFEERVVDDRVTVRMYRRLKSASGLYGHISVLYPNLIELPNFEEADTVVCNGATYNRERALIPASSTEDNCVVELVMLTSAEQNAEYDFVLAISTPSDCYNDYRDSIALWIYYLEIVPPEKGNYVDDTVVPEDPAAQDVQI